MSDKELILNFKDRPLYPDNILRLFKYFCRTNISFLYIIIDEFLALEPSDEAVYAYADTMSYWYSDINKYLPSLEAFCTSRDKDRLIARLRANKASKGYLDIPQAYVIAVLNEDISILQYFGRNRDWNYSMLNDKELIPYLSEYFDYLLEKNKALSVAIYEDLIDNYTPTALDDRLIALYKRYSSNIQDRLARVCPKLLKGIKNEVITHKRAVTVEEKILKLLSSIREEIVARKRNTSIELFRKAEELPICELFDLYLKNHTKLIYFSTHRFTLRDLQNQHIFGHYDNFNLYFDASLSYDIGYDLKGVPNSLDYIYTAKDKLGNTCFRMKFQNEGNPYTDYVDYFESSNYSSDIVPVGATLIIQYIDKLPTSAEIRAKGIAAFNEAKREYELKAFLAAFNRVERAAKALRISTLAPNSRVRVEYSFSLNGLGIELSLRLGINKLYQVSSLTKTLNAFRTGEVVKYGKGLEFAHKIDNLADEDKGPMSVLYIIDTSSKGKSMPISEALFSELLERLKGREILIDDKRVRVRLNEVEPKAFLDSDYRLQLKDDCHDIIKAGANTYIIDIENNLDIISSRIAPLIRLVESFENISLAGVKKDFNDRLYSLYNDNIEIDPYIMDEFKLNLLEINAYFELNMDNRITVETKYIKDGIEISSDDISLEGDSLRARRYLDMLDLCGFNEAGIMEADEDILSFLRLDLTALKELCNIYLGKRLESKRLVSFTPPSIRINYGNDIIGVFLEKSQFDADELIKILEALRNDKKFVLLKDDSILSLDNKESKDFYEAIDDLNLDEKKLDSEQYKPLYQTLVAFNHLDSIEIDDYLKNIANDISGFKAIKPKLPDIKATLRPYQLEGYSWLRILSKYKLGGILADDMGLGKTLQMITLLKSDEKEMPSLIVSPKSLIYNWISEFNSFVPDLELIPINGPANKREEIINSIDPNKRAFYITSYDSARIDSDKYKAKLNYLILDEAQYIKNALAMTAKRIKKINSLNHFALTGTPIENDIFDLWSIFDFLMPGYLPAVSEFKKYGNDEAFHKKIRRRVAPFILRRTKEAVLKDLPPKYERVISAEMTEEQRKLYDAECLEAKRILKNNGSSFEVMHLLTRLRQICVDPRTFLPDFSYGSGKLILLNELVRDYTANGHRILIFSQFVKALNYVMEELKAQGLSYLMITGDTKSIDRIKYVNEFNKNEEYKVFLISLKAGGTGLNLVGADTVIHLDPWWNLASQNQATDRAHRIGQTRSVEVIKLIVSNSIEERVIELQNKKKDLVDRLISNDTSLIEGVTIDDLKFILE